MRNEVVKKHRGGLWRTPLRRCGDAATMRRLIYSSGHFRWMWASDETVRDRGSFLWGGRRLSLCVSIAEMFTAYSARLAALIDIGICLDICPWNIVDS